MAWGGISRVWALFVALALSAPGLVGGVAAAEDRYDLIRSEGVIRIGYALEAPYALVRGGQVTGESPELAKLVAARLGIAEIDWVQVPFAELIPGLRSGTFDVVAAGMFMTADRARVVTFSDPTLRVAPGFLVRQGNPFGLRKYLDLLVRTEVRVAVLAGSVEEWTLERRGVSPSRMRRVADAEAGRAQVAEGRADVLALSLPTVRWMAGGGLEAVAVAPEAGQPFPVFPVAFAFAKDQPRLARAWNAAQSEVLGGSAHLARVAPFGFTIVDFER